MKSNHCFHGAKEDAKQRSRPRRHALFMALHRVGLSFSLPHQIKAFFVIFSFHSNATFLSQKFRPRVLPLTLPGLPDCWKHCMMTLGCTDLQRNQKTRLSFQWEIWKKKKDRNRNLFFHPKAENWMWLVAWWPLLSVGQGHIKILQPGQEVSSNLNPYMQALSKLPQSGPGDT